MAHIEESSPYYVHPGENPSLVLVSPPLIAANYHSWSRSMKMALLSKNKLDFVDGTINKPAVTSNLYHPWKRCNNLILTWMVHCVSPNIAQGIIGQESARTVWDNLCEKFSRGDAFRLASLQGEIYSIQQGARSITDYYTFLSNLWTKYSELKDWPACICEACVCNALTQIKDKIETDFTICFLKGLNDSFSTIKSQIMVTDAIPAANKVFAMVLQHERQFCPPKSIQMQNVAAFVQRTGQRTGQGFNSSKNPTVSYNNNNKQTVCTHCGYIGGHTVDTCYKKHGYPHGFKKKPSNGVRRSTVNMVGSDGLSTDFDGDIAGPTPNVPNNASVGFTSEQLQQIAQIVRGLSTDSHNSANNAFANVCISGPSAPALIGSAHGEASTSKSGYADKEADWFS